MAKVIIGIHGLGNKPSKELITKWWRQSIREGLSGIGKYVFNPKLEMVYWADILYDKPLDENITDPKDPCCLVEKYVPASKNYKPTENKIRKKVLDLLGNGMDKIFLNKDLSANYSFVTDFIIRKYFKDLEIYYSPDPKTEGDKTVNARELIRKRLTDILNKHKKDKIFLITHSMGTIIAYDVLTLQLTNSKIDTFITIGSPLGIPIVISKFSSEYKSTFDNEYVPSTPALVTGNWYNFSDLEDKVAADYDLANDYIANKDGVKVIDYIVNNNYELNGEKNPHKAYGYLRTPEFAYILFNFMMKDRMKITVRLLNTLNNFYEWAVRRIIKRLEKLYSVLTGLKYEA